MWEKGVTNEDSRSDIVQELNEKLQTTFKAACVLKLWSYGTRTRIHTAQVNVNRIEAA